MSNGKNTVNDERGSMCTAFTGPLSGQRTAIYCRLLHNTNKTLIPASLWSENQTWPPTRRIVMRRF